MVVLDQYGVVQAHAVVGDASGFGCRFFQLAQAWGGFSCIQNAAVGVGYFFCECLGQGGYSGEALEEVQGCSLSFQEGAGFGRGLWLLLSFGGEGVAVFVVEFDVFVEFGQDRCAGQCQGFAG